MQLALRQTPSLKARLRPDHAGGGSQVSSITDGVRRRSRVPERWRSAEALGPLVSACPRLARDRQRRVDHAG